MADVEKHRAKIINTADYNDMIYSKNSKYNNRKVEVDGIKFDSQKEADYYCELKLMLAAGEIRGFCRQAEFILAPNLRYKADFIVINNDGTAEIIDVKRL